MKKYIPASFLYITLLTLLIACSKDSSDETPSTPSYTLTVNQSEGGTVNSSGGSYQRGTEVSISATPNQGYVFTGWSNGSTSNPLNITLNSNIEISPRFEQAIVSRLELSLAQTSVMMGQETNYTYMAYDQNDGPLPDAVPTISISDSLFARIENQRIITEYDGLLTIYGRINEVVDSIQLEIQPDYNNWKTYFRPIENGIPDLSDVCNNGGNCANTNSVKIDLNNDGRQDLLLHFFKDRDVLNVPDDTPVYNRLIALISNENNQLENKTLDVFGNEIVDLEGGVSGNFKVLDINSDGYDDVVYALHREDGRSLTDLNTWKNFPVAVISNGDGTYQKQRFGQMEINGDVCLIKNVQNEIEVILGSNENINNHYLYSGSSFNEKSSTFLNRNGVTMNSYLDPSLDRSSYLIYSKSGTSGLSFYNLNTTVFKIKDIEFPPTTTVSYTTWLGNTFTEFPVVEINNYTLIGVTFNDLEFIRVNPNEPPLVLAHLSSNYYNGTVSEGQTITSDQTPIMSKIFAFDMSDSEEELELFPNKGIHEKNVNFIEVLDVNNDGFDDVVKYPYSYEGKPIVYLNNTSGSFIELANNNIFPSFIEGVDTSQFIDVNGDGILDIVFRYSGTSSDYIQPLLFLGRKPLPNQ